MNLKRNDVETKCEVREGDCRRVAPKKQADRVLLGLLPSSQGGWKTALEALKPDGGWLHVHENVKDSEESTCIKKIVNELMRHSSELGYNWLIEVKHCEHVKWYAPHIRHIVLDIYCRQVIPQGLIETSDVMSKTQFWSDVVPKRKPHIIKGMKLGQATEIWNAEYLSSTKESQETFVSAHVCTDEGGRMNFVEKNFTFHTMSFSELIERCAELKNHKPLVGAGERYYLRSIGENPRKERSWIQKSFPVLSKDLELPNLVDKDQLFSTVLRVSSPNHQLWTHFDVMDNLLIQIVGTKIIKFWPPSQEPYLYVKGSSSEVVDMTNPDLTKYPLFQQARGFEWRLEPGDVVYIPALWFHSVTSQTFSVSVNTFFQHLPEDCYDRKDLYGNKDPVPVQQALVHASHIIQLLDQLPDDFRQFYGARISTHLKTHGL